MLEAGQTAAQVGWAELSLFLDTAWDFVCTEFTIYGYTFSYAQVGVFGVIASWTLWGFLEWMDF